MASENLLARASTQEEPTTRLAILRGPPDIPLLRRLFRPPYVCACPGTRCTRPVHLKTASSGLDWDMCVGTKDMILFGMGPRMRFLDIRCEIFRWNEQTPLHMPHWVSQHVRIGRGVVHISWTQAVWQRIKKGPKLRYEGEVKKIGLRHWNVERRGGKGTWRTGLAGTRLTRNLDILQ